MNLQSIYLQLFSLGFFWTFFHCVPMCGPIVGGLPLADGDSKSSSSTVEAFFLYQAGRSVMYSLFGAMAGILGSPFTLLQPRWGWILVFILLVILVSHLFPKWFSSSAFKNLPLVLSRISHGFSGKVRAFFFGIVFAFLPCSLTIWVLSLAGASGSAWHGIILMNFLILLTCLPLLVAILGGQWLRRWRFERAGTIALVASICWTSLSTAAASGWIDHQSLEFMLFDRHYMLMFW